MSALALLSVEWIEAYREEWNRNPAAIEGTTGMDALIELHVTDIEGRAPVQMHICGQDGHADYAGAPRQGEDPTFVLKATSETWRRVGHGEMGVKRAIAGPVKFQGSMVTAMKHFSGLEAALRQFGRIPTAEWS